VREEAVRMANKFRWFTHDHDAHEDGWLRHVIRKQGHVAGWLWWVLVEQFHKHGVGDVLKRDIADIAKAGLTSTSVVNRVLTELGTEFEGQLKVRWKLVGTELELEIPKLRKRLAKLKSKVPPKFLQSSSKVPIHIEGEGEGEKDRTKPAKLAPAGLFSLWNETANGSLPKARELTSKRARAAMARIREHGDPAYWRQVIAAINASNFCCGKNDRGWTADFDWLLRPGTCVSVLEGKYKNRTNGNGKFHESEFA